jgi:hypothetical protein
MRLRRRYSHPIDRARGLICDQTVTLTERSSRKNSPAPLRWIRFRDPQSGKRLIFLTNNFTVRADYRPGSIDSAGRSNCSFG